jgi:hypothetical protein
MGIHVEKVIYAAPSEVARVMFDSLNESGWITGVGAAEQLTPGPLAVGSRTRRQGNVLGAGFDWVTEVTALEPDRLLKMKFVEGPIHGELTFEVTPTAGGSIAIVRNDDAKRSPIGTWALQSTIEGDLRRLAALVASQQAHSQTA